MKLLNFFQELYSLIRCPLNHRFVLVREDAKCIVHVCQKCGKRITRSL